MYGFLTLITIAFAIFNFTISKEVLDFSYCFSVFQVCAACFIAYVWGADS